MSEWPKNNDEFVYVPVVPPGNEVGPKFPTRADVLFERLDAREWIDQVRVEKDGKLDMFATAERLGIPLFINRAVNGNELSLLADGQTTGMGVHRGKEPIAIYLRPDNPPEKQPLIFGHEVGHIFLEEISKVYIHGQQNQDVERFCEYFGREMAVDPTRLSEIGDVDRETILNLMDKYGIDHETLILQLMRAGKLPGRVAIDTTNEVVPNEFYSGKVERGVICADCETGIDHEPYVVGDEIQAFDFTDKEWGFSFNQCTPHGVEHHITLNKAYGRWSDADEALINRELKREAGMRRLRRLINERMIPTIDEGGYEPF